MDPLREFAPREPDPYGYPPQDQMSSYGNPLYATSGDGMQNVPQFGVFSSSTICPGPNDTFGPAMTSYTNPAGSMVPSFLTNFDDNMPTANQLHPPRPYLPVPQRNTPNAFGPVPAHPHPNQSIQMQNAISFAQDETNSSNPVSDAGSGSRSSDSIASELSAGVEGGANDAPSVDTEDTAGGELQGMDVYKVTDVQDYGREGEVLEGTDHFAKKFAGVNSAKAYMSRSRHRIKVQDDDVDEVEKHQEHHTIRIYEAMRTLPNNSAESYDRTFKTIQRNGFKNQKYLEACAGKIVSSVIDLHRNGTHLHSGLQLEGNEVEQIKASERIEKLVDMLYVRKTIVKDIIDGWKFDAIVAQPSVRLQNAIDTLKNNEKKKKNLDSMKERLRKGEDGDTATPRATTTKPKSKGGNKVGRGGNKAAGDTKKGAKKGGGRVKATRARDNRKKRARDDSDESETDDVVAGGELNDAEVGVTEKSEIEGASGIQETTEAEEAQEIEQSEKIEDVEQTEDATASEADENDQASEEDLGSEYEDEEAPPARNDIDPPSGHPRLGGKGYPGYFPSKGFYAPVQVPSRGRNKRKGGAPSSLEAGGGHNLRKRQKK